MFQETKLLEVGSTFTKIAPYGTGAAKLTGPNCERVVGSHGQTIETDSRVYALGVGRLIYLKEGVAYVTSGPDDEHPFPIETEDGKSRFADIICHGDVVVLQEKAKDTSTFRYAKLELGSSPTWTLFQFSRHVKAVKLLDFDGNRLVVSTEDSEKSTPVWVSAPVVQARVNGTLQVDPLFTCSTTLNPHGAHPFVLAGHWLTLRDPGRDSVIDTVDLDPDEDFLMDTTTPAPSFPTDQPPRLFLRGPSNEIYASCRGKHPGLVVSQSNQRVEVTTGKGIISQVVAAGNLRLIQRGRGIYALDRKTMALVARHKRGVSVLIENHALSLRQGRLKIFTFTQG